MALQRPWMLGLALLAYASGCGGSWTLIAAGSSHTCGVRGDRALCWGLNDDGYLGIGEQTRPEPGIVPRPHEVKATGPWKSLAAEDTGACAVDEDGALVCWGVRPGPGDVPDTWDEGTWRAVFSGPERYCAIRADGSAACWGPNAYGELGTGDQQAATFPADVVEAGPWATLDSSFGHTCGVKEDGTLWCWGMEGGPAGDTSALGLGTFVCPPDALPRCTELDTTVPRQVGADADWVSVATLPIATCATRTDGSLWCWGLKGDVDLPIPDEDIQGDWEEHCLQPCTPDPQQVGEDTDWTRVGAGSFGGCAWKEDGSAWCWGYLMAEEPLDAPEELDLGPTWETLSIGRAHACGIATDGHAWCWGENRFGQLGDGTTTDHSRPVRVR